MATTVHKCELHVDDDGNVYLKMLNLDQTRLDALRTDFERTPNFYAGVEDPPIGPIPRPCKIIILDCTGWGDGA